MRKYLSAIAAASVLVPVVAFAAPNTPDRPPTDQERAAIEGVLKANDFVSWDDIEFDDGRWEVDDARLQNGEQYDVKLAPETLRVIRRSRDD